MDFPLPLEPMMDANSPFQIVRSLAFNASVGLPVTLAQIELTENDLQTVADKAATVLEWRCSLQTFTKEAFVQAMRDADAAGKKYLANQ